jgi:hypothetical protein
MRFKVIIKKINLSAFMLPPLEFRLLIGVL